MADAAPSAKVIPIGTIEERAALVRAYLASKEPTLKITNMREAMSYGDAWRREAERMELLYIIATIHCKSSDTLLAIAEEECARLKALNVNPDGRDKERK